MGDKTALPARTHSQLTELEVLARVLDSLTRLISLPGGNIGPAVRATTLDTVLGIQEIVNHRRTPQP